MKICPLLAALGIFAVSPVGFFVHAEEPAGPAATGGPESVSADALWTFVQSLAKGLDTKQKTKEELNTLVTTLNYAAVEFVKKYPKDQRVWAAKMHIVQTEHYLATLGRPGFETAHAMALVREISEARDAPEKDRIDADLFLLLDAQQKDPANMEKVIADYRKKHPGDALVDKIRLNYAELLAETDQVKAAALYEELSGSKNKKVADAARARLHVADLVGKPVDLKFTAVNGEEVDVSKMIGKVVLIDFWEAGSPQGMGEEANVVAAYKKYHDRGLEVVGISLDDHLSLMMEATRKNGATWPQYFDGKGLENEMGLKFGIDCVPKIWLIDKKGVLVTLNARWNLEEQVEKLLAQ